jgi:hypothetical protein
MRGYAHRMTGGTSRIDRQPELVFGLIGALGAGLSAVGDALRRELREVGYQVGDHPIKLSHLMHRLPGPPFDALSRDGRRAGVEAYMDAGTALRERLRPDALALFAVTAIRVARREQFGEPADGPAKGTALILDSLKHHEEVETLRRLYGPAFIAVGVYTPYEQRVDAVRKRLRESAGRGTLDEYGPEAERLIEKDRDEQEKPFGQYVSDAFALADVVVSTTGGETSSIERFIGLLFGDWTKTPTPGRSRYDVRADRRLPVVVDGSPGRRCDLSCRRFTCGNRHERRTEVRRRHLRRKRSGRGEDGCTGLQRLRFRYE